MKKPILLLLLCLSIITVQADIQFETGTWKEVVAKATKENKPIFVDMYAVWCGPCKWIENNVFTDDDVAAYFNANYVNYRIDAEKEELDLVESVNLDAYPTLVFFRPDGGLIHKAVGAIDSYQLLELGEMIASKPKVEAAYKNNPKDTEALIDVLFFRSKESPRAAQDLAWSHLEDAPDLWETAQGWELVLEYITRPSLAQAKEITSHFGYYVEQEDFPNYVVAVYENLLQEAVELNNPDLLDGMKHLELAARTALEIKDKPDAYYGSYVDAVYYFYQEDWDQFSILLDKHLSAFAQNDVEEYVDWLSELIQYGDDEDLYVKMKSWSNDALAIERRADILVFSALIRYELEELDEALTFIKEAKEVNTDDQWGQIIDELTSTIESER